MSATLAPTPARGLALRIALGAGLLGVAGVGVIAARVWPHQIGLAMDAVMHATNRLGAAGWIVAAAAQVLIALCGILPASAGALMTGMLYGVFAGFVLSAVGTFIGATLAFGLARSLFRPVVVRLLGHRRRFGQLDTAVARDGWRLVCLLRMSPVMPFAVTSYALGLTSLSLRDYLIGTLASLPALLGYVVLGHLAKAGLSSLTTPGTAPLRWAVLTLAIIATALLTARLGRIASGVIRPSGTRPVILPPDPDRGWRGLRRERP